MRYYKNLLIGNTIDNVDEIIALLDKGTPTFGIYVICINDNSQNIMEIMFCGELFKEINADKDYCVIGIERGKKKAVDMVKDIIEDWFKVNGDLEGIKEYYSSNSI